MLKLVALFLFVLASPPALGAETKLAYTDAPVPPVVGMLVPIAEATLKQKPGKFEMMIDDDPVDPNNRLRLPGPADFNSTVVSHGGGDIAPVGSIISVVLYVPPPPPAPLMEIAQVIMLFVLIVIVWVYRKPVPGPGR